MSKTIGKYRAVLALKCPRCRQGDLFDRKGLLVYSNMMGMPKFCPVCNQKYEIEPGFWIGSLWTSYPIVVLIEFPFLMLALFNKTIGPWVPLTFMFVAFIIAFPIMLRLGRSIWISIWVKFEGKSVG